AGILPRSRQRFGLASIKAASARPSWGLGHRREIAQIELLQRRQDALRLFFAVPPLRSARPFLATGCVSRPRSWRLLLEWFLVERLISIRILSGRKRRCAPHRTHPRRRQEI